MTQRQPSKIVRSSRHCRPRVGTTRFGRNARSPSRPTPRCTSIPNLNGEMPPGSNHRALSIAVHRNGAGMDDGGFRRGRALRPEAALVRRSNNRIPSPTRRRVVIHASNVIEHCVSMAASSALAATSRPARNHWALVSRNTIQARHLGRAVIAIIRMLMGGETLEYTQAHSGQKSGDHAFKSND